MKLEIRDYTSNDYNDLSRLLFENYESKIDKDLLEKQYLNKYKRIILAENTDLKEVIGCMFTELQQDFIRPRKIIYVTYLAVDEKYRGLGIGKTLLGKAESMCTENGCEAVELTSADFRIEAHRFYEKVGYTKKKTTLFIKDV